ncbi:DNA-directed RNA polymerase subunit omega [Desulfurivibrio dismutans]|uniref:DNA-directed RNA polymerase subunit omega n=1 Tax=Desulfurivibrio dismutans TaxID=1398908 RepID=UPI0023DAA3D5|nr:DNA-directed RNA polymerase subunit omega [Desulfurivibrio alkaliphilus]MDF1615189.1 DNA-directed RNA polymerase subunit omega [Desulfurivibrio alkaliphilus]
MARITVEDCLQQIGNENRFALIHLAVERVKQHRQGAPFPERCKNKEIVCTLREIANGQVNFNNVRELKKQLQQQTAANAEPEAEPAPAAPAAEA